MTEAATGCFCTEFVNDGYWQEQSFVVVSIMRCMQYDVIKIVEFNVQQAAFSDESNLRQPSAGKGRIIIEVYSLSTGYELECSNEDGITQWIVAFRPVVLDLRR